MLVEYLDNLAADHWNRGERAYGIVRGYLLRWRKFQVICGAYDVATLFEGIFDFTGGK